MVTPIIIITIGCLSHFLVLKHGFGTTSEGCLALRGPLWDLLFYFLGIFDPNILCSPENLFST